MASLTKLAVAWYNLWLLIGTFTVWVVSVLSLAPFKVYGPNAQRRVAGVVLKFCRLCWRWPFTLSPWIRVRVHGLQHQHEMGRSGKPVLIIGNHTSFMDTLVFATHISFGVISRVRTLAKSSLWQLPLLGTLMNSVGHIPVHFHKQSADNDFKTDETQKQALLDRVDEHVGRDGGWICMFPEGQIHRGDGSAGSAKLQPFRIGGMGLALQYDMELWAWTAKGNNDCWPRTGIGGLPSTITASLVPIAPRGSRELMREIDPSCSSTFAADEIKLMLPKLVTHAQQFMQAELDKLYERDK